ncbi:hypothetical protein DF040_13200 [Burkholderia cenocepacia]|nr:hypothetical protein DF040_13200 [Burkholderia cenocepacia]
MRGRCVSGRPERARVTHRFGATPPHAAHTLHASRTTNAHDGTPDAHGTHLAAYISDTRRTQNSAVLR